MRYSDDTIQEILGAVSIVDVINEYTSLQNKGNSWTGLCPFHNEKTPSFHVDEAKGVYYCFGCGQGGNLFSFLRDIEGLSFKEAIEILAERAGIELKREKGNYSSTGLVDVLTLAHQFYVHNFNSDIGKEAREYLKSRDISFELAGEFGIGYSPEGWDNFINVCKKKQIDLNLLYRCGLATDSKRGTPIDFFRNGLIIPIRNRARKIIAFGMRNLSKDGPKYINSPEHELYKKGATLFGLAYARQEIRKKNKVYICEGYFDAISLWQKGIKNAIAGCGTALTSSQAEQISRITETAVLFYDGDNAGQEATLKAIPILLETGLKTNVIELENGIDPDDFARSSGTELFTEKIENPMDFFDYLYKNAKIKFPDNDVPSRNGILQYMAKSISSIPDTILRDMYVNALSSKIQMNQDELRRYILNRKYESLERAKTATTSCSPEAQQELFLIACLLFDNNILNRIKKINPFTLYRGIYNEMRDYFEIEGLVSVNDIGHLFESSDDRSYLVSQIMRLKGDTVIEEFFIHLIELQICSLQKQSKEIRDMLTEAESNKDKERIDELFKNSHILKLKLKKLKGYQSDIPKFLIDVFDE